MKANFKSIILGCVIGATISNVIPVMGYNGTRNIQAVFKNIKICVDGVQMTPRDTAGNVIEPFIYNGTTYLPIRAVGEATGKEVTWDGATSTVYLGKSSMTSYLGQQVKAYKLEAAEEGTATLGGKKYLNSLILSRLNGNAYYNLNGMYTSVSGVYAMEDGAEDDYECMIHFYGDDRLIETLHVQGGKLPKNFVINVSGVTQLKIVKEDDNRFGWYRACLGSVEFH